MASDSSFDIVSKVDKQEVSNALNQAQKEVAQRYDFRGVGAEIDFSGEKILIKANSDERALAVLDVFQSKLVKRGISLKSLDAGEPQLPARALGRPFGRRRRKPEARHRGWPRRRPAAGGFDPL